MPKTLTEVEAKRAIANNNRFRNRRVDRRADRRAADRIEEQEPRRGQMLLVLAPIALAAVSGAAYLLVRRLTGDIDNDGRMA